MKTKQSFVVCAALCAFALVIGSCAGLGKAQGTAASAAISAQAARTATEFTVLDWQNRALGEIASPPWLLAAARGDWRPFKAEWPTEPGTVLKLDMATAARQNVAMTIADVQYAARLANQLKQTVLTRAAISLGSDGEFDAVNDAATKTKVELTGQERLTDFWQKIETVDERGKKVITYNYYVVYACDESIWNQLVGKYVWDVVGQLPEKKTQQTMAALLKEIDEATKAETPVSEEQFKIEITARQTALAQGGVPKEEQRAAYRSGDPAKAAAASTTPADKDYVAALAALANQ